MIFGRSIRRFAILTLALSAFVLRAQTAPTVPDPLGVRAALENAEKQHRETYTASKFAEAIVAARQGLALAERAGTIDDQVQFVRHLAYDNYLMGDSDSSIEYSERLLDFAERLDSNRIRAQAHRYLSQVYEAMNNDARTRSHAESSLRFAQLAGDEEVRIAALTAIGVSQARAGHYDTALKAFEECRAYWAKQRRPWNTVNSLVNIADVVAARGDLPGALQRYEEILAARVENKDLSGQVRTVVSIAGILRRLGRANEALPRLLAVRPLAESIGAHLVLAEFYSNLAQVQEGVGDFSAALGCQRRAAAEREQLVGERARLRATELEARLDLLQKQQAIDQLRTQVAVHEARLRAAAADLAQDRSYLIALIDGIVAIVVVALSGWLVMRYRGRSQRLHAAVAGALKSTGLPPPAE